jgi:hypothetical protein
MGWYYRGKRDHHEDRAGPGAGPVRREHIVQDDGVRTRVEGGTYSAEERHILLRTVLVGDRRAERQVASERLPLDLASGQTLQSQIGN